VTMQEMQLQETHVYIRGTAFLLWNSK